MLHLYKSDYGQLQKFANALGEDLECEVLNFYSQDNQLIYANSDIA